MAPVSSLNSHPLLSKSSFPLLQSPEEQGIRRDKNTRIFCCKKIILDQEKACLSVVEDYCSWRRRDVLLQAVSATLYFPYAALAAEGDVSEGLRVYTDEVNKFKISIPKDWKVGHGEGDGVRSLTAFYPSKESESNVSLVISLLGADYTRLESFGKVDAFAENLVGGLDRSWQRPPGVAAKLIDCRASNGLYYIEYTLKNPGESGRHLFSVLGIADNGTYNRLFTLTGQFVDEEEESFGSKIQKAVSSFKLI